MRNIALLSAFGLCACIALAGSDKLQPLNVKTGLWQTTTTMKIKGQLPITPDMQARLAQMTPEQRARFEAAMSKMSSGTPTTRTYKNCVTKEQLNTNPFSEKECTWSTLSSTGSKLDAKGVCVMGKEDVKTNIAMHLDVADSEHVKGSGKVTMTGGDRTMTNDFDITSKYVGSDCKGAD